MKILQLAFVSLWSEIQSFQFCSKALNTRSYNMISNRYSRKLMMGQASSKVAPPREPIDIKRRGDGDGDGLRLMNAAQVREALLAFEAGVNKYSQIGTEKSDQMDLILRMEEWADTFENFRRIGCRKITVGSYKTGRLLCIAGLDIKWGGYPEYDISMIVRLLTISPKYDKRSVGFETLHLLQELGQANALQLDCSNLKEIPSLRFFVLGSAKTLGADPEVLNPRQLCYKKYVKKSTFVLDNVPDWADLGPFWFEGTTQDGVSFWFRKRTPTLLNEFQICWDHPEVGNSTGIGTVGGARVIGLDKSLKCEDIRGWAKIEEIRANLSLKIESEVKKSENLNNSDESA